MSRKDLIKTKLVNGPNRPSTLVVTFDCNALSTDFFARLNEVIDGIETYQNTTDKEERIDGVVFTSSKDKIFLAGADLFQISELLDDVSSYSNRVLGAIVKEGQRTFNRIENLKVPTVAAIHGACLGGGFELTLACDYRICSNDRATKLGLPEVSLGILPAWGGVTRLPQLISLPNAVKVLLSGSQFAAKPARKLGLVDDIVHRENLVEAAIHLVRHKPQDKRRQPLVHRLLPAGLVLNRARKTVMQKTKGNYPAPLKILDVLERGLDTNPKVSLSLERKAFLELIRTDAARNLIGLFFKQEQSKKLKLYDTDSKKISQAVVVGAGTMGAGIAQWISSRGVNVLLKDIDNKTVGKGLKKIGDLYVQGVLAHKLDRPAARDGLARVTGTTSSVPFRNKEIVIEAIVEKLDIKQKVLAQLEEKLPNDAIIATNTSALSIDEMAKCLKYPERFVGIHFFNPVHKMKLVEVVRGSKTSDETVQRAVRFVQQIGKLPVVVKDRPGFVVNRILIPYLMKAADMLTQEGQQIEAIDAAMVKFGMPMGPFRLMDEIGLDVCYHVAKDLKDRLDIKGELDELSWRIHDGMLGKKSGQGFYRYKKGRSIKDKVTKPANVDVLIKAMTDESYKVLTENVIDSADMLDFAMVMGTGWAPFRGGPLAYSTSQETIIKEHCPVSLDKT